MGVWIQAGALVASGIGVIVTILANRGIAKRKVTLDHIVFSETNQEMVELRREFVKLKNAGNLLQYASREKIVTPEAITIRKILNYYEIIAIGIRARAFHEGLFKSWWRHSLVQEWIACKDFVHSYQQQHNPRLFCEFEALAKKWANDDERKHV